MKNQNSESTDVNKNIYQGDKKKWQVVRRNRSIGEKNAKFQKAHNFEGKKHPICEFENFNKTNNVNMYTILKTLNISITPTISI